MEILTEIQNWLEEFKTKYKPIGIYPLPKNIEDPEEFYKELEEDYSDVKNGVATIGIGSQSVEDLAVLVRYLRKRSEVEIICYDEHDDIYNIFNPDEKPKMYSTPEELYSSKGGVSISRGSNIYIKVKKADFPKFWSSFLYEFLLPLKYVGDSTWFLEYYKTHDL